MIGPIQSAGGPYLVMAAAAVSRWKGAEDAAAYEAVCAGPDLAWLTRVAGCALLVLGTPDPLYCHAIGHGAILVRAVSFDADDDRVLARHMAGLPRDGWSALGGHVVVGRGGLVAFDAALPGRDVASDALHVELAPGRYGVSSATYAPNESTELLVTRLQASRADRGGRGSGRARGSGCSR